MVRVVRLERTVSWSQTRRDTNFAIPGYSFFCHDTTASGKNKDFSVCGHLCGQNRFYAAFGNREKSRKRRCHEAFRRFALPRPGYSHGTPKAGALPTALHPVIKLNYPAGRILPKPGAIPTSLYPDAYGRRFCAARLLYLTFHPDARWNRNFFPSMPQALRLRRSPPPPGGRP